MKILIIAEHENQKLKFVIFHIVSSLRALQAEVDVLIVGNECEPVVAEAQQYLDVQRILVADHPAYQYQLAENISKLIQNIASNYHYIVMGATTFGKNILPRVAALLDVAMISDVVKIVSPDTFVRPIYAGNALATVKSNDTIKLLTIRSTAFSAEKRAGTAVVEKITHIFENKLSYFKEQKKTVSNRPELESARIVISGGRGLKSADNFKLLENLADQLGAAVGATRAAVDAGFVPNDYQVGQTGKIVAPDLYMAIGISGAIQHLAGMKESKVIVAINNDPDAPIFEVADYALIGDLFKILPELQKELSK